MISRHRAQATKVRRNIDNRASNERKIIKQRLRWTPVIEGGGSATERNETSKTDRQRNVDDNRERAEKHRKNVNH